MADRQPATNDEVPLTFDQRMAVRDAAEQGYAEDDAMSALGQRFPRLVALTGGWDALRKQWAQEQKRLQDAAEDD